MSCNHPLAEYLLMQCLANLVPMQLLPIHALPASRNSRHWRLRQESSAEPAKVPSRCFASPHEGCWEGTAYPAIWQLLGLPRRARNHAPHAVQEAGGGHPAQEASGQLPLRHRLHKRRPLSLLGAASAAGLHPARLTSAEVLPRPALEHMQVCQRPGSSTVVQMPGST